MKRDYTKIVSAAVLTLSMAMLSLTLPAKAQINPTPGTNNPPTTTYDRTSDGNDSNWGWLGLIGLLGLAGLAGKKRDDEPTRYRDPNSPSATSYRE
ncbi:WGxxGxxG family protein [Nostoc sp. TCL26-01]|uniref:WGxxGxxG family protein n=1 Tax=Nostoc sp. TCL26-01 TaxID=2576904 RepID=UPI0015BB88CD|nr:WGxxGxxG family protein [Nostoc sp. TCL26-01]QLE59293.1 hypothetical protein FD725_06340 [Nostoc sp. TCL26-01]